MIYKPEQGPFDSWYVRCYENGLDTLVSALFSGEDCKFRATAYAMWMNRREELRLCVSDPGGCDGDLVGLDHRPECPATKHLKEVRKLNL